MEGSAHSRLIFALDVASSREAEAWALRLAQEIGLAKVGLELFAAAGPEVVRAVQRSAGVPVFLDLKLHDIPITVERSARAVRELGVRMLTAHAQGGEAMLDAAVRGAGPDMQVLAVTRLTSQRASPAEVVELARVNQPQIGTFGENLDLTVLHRHVALGAGGPAVERFAVEQVDPFSIAVLRGNGVRIRHSR